MSRPIQCHHFRGTPFYNREIVKLCTPSMIQNSENHTLIGAHTYYGEVSDCLRTPPPSPSPPLSIRKLLDSR